MSMDLEIKKYQCDPQYFEAGPHPIAKAVKTASEDIPAHGPVELADGKVKKIVSGSEDKVYGIAPEEIKANEDGVIYLTGEFFADSLALEESVKASALEEPFRQVGIFLKGVKAENP